MTPPTSAAAATNHSHHIGSLVAASSPASSEGVGDAAVSVLASSEGVDSLGDAVALDCVPADSVASAEPVALAVPVASADSVESDGGCEVGDAAADSLDLSGLAEVGFALGVGLAVGLEGAGLEVLVGWADSVSSAVGLTTGVRDSSAVGDPSSGGALSPGLRVGDEGLLVGDRETSGNEMPGEPDTPSGGAVGSETSGRSPVHPTSAPASRTDPAMASPKRPVTIDLLEVDAHSPAHDPSPRSPQFPDRRGHLRVRGRREATAANCWEHGSAHPDPFGGWRSGHAGGGRGAARLKGWQFGMGRSRRAADRSDADRFRVAMLHSTIGIATMTPRGHYVEVNDALCRILGRPREELTSRTWQSLTHPDDLEISLEADDSVLTGRTDSYMTTKRYLRPDGSVVHATVSAGCVRDDEGDVDYFVVQVVDISEQVEAQEKFRLVAENIWDAVALTDHEGVLTWVSPSVTTEMGWVPEELVGQSFPDLIHPEDVGALTVDGGALVTATLDVVEVRMRVPGGGYLWAKVHVKPRPDAGEGAGGRLISWWQAQLEHETDEARARSDARLRGAMEAALDMHVFLEAVRDHRGRVVDFVVSEANDQAVEHLQLRRSGLIGHRVRDLYSTATAEAFIARLAEPIETGVPFTAEALPVTLVDEERRYDIRGVRVADGLSLVWRDVTERVAEREALETSERYFRLLAENASDVVLQTDRDRRILWVSPSVRQFLGYRPEELIGRNTDELVLAADLPALHASRDESAGARSVRLRLARGDGGSLWTDVTATRLFDDEGTFVGRVVSVRDVDEQVRAHSALEESERLFRLLAENASDVVVVTDRLATVQWVSPSVTDILGRAPEELVGHSIHDLLHEADSPDPDRLGDGEAAAHAVRLRGRIRGSGGDWRWFEAVGRPFHDEHGELVGRMGAMRDIHDEVIAAQALARSEQQARDLASRYELARDAALEANRAKTAFLSRMSHELRTPLNAVMGFAQVLEMDDLTDDQRDSLDHILVGGKHLLDLIGEILDISRIEAGRLSVSIEPVLVSEAVAEAVDLVRPFASRAGIRVVTASRCGRTVLADRQRLIQIVLNLLTNAVKYNAEGGTITISCSDGPTEGTVGISVADTGVGISRENLAKLFQPFERLGAETGAIEGTGIGLTLSQGLAGAMNGHIEVESTRGRGSTFTLVLPASAAIHPEVGFIADPVSLIGSGEVRVLYIEDNLANAQLVARVLGRVEGVRAEHVANGALGLERALADPPDLILLDLHLPDMGGDEVLRHLRDDPRTTDVPVVIVTADASPDLRTRVTVLGADDVLTKPIELTRLLAWVSDPRMGRTPA